MSLTKANTRMLDGEVPLSQIPQITNDKLAGSISEDKLSGSIATSKLAEVIDDDTMTTGVSATSLASSESIKAYVDAQVSGSTASLSVPANVSSSGTASSHGFLIVKMERGVRTQGQNTYYEGGLTTVTIGSRTYKEEIMTSVNQYGEKHHATMTIPIRSGHSWAITIEHENPSYPIMTATAEFISLS